MPHAPRPPQWAWPSSHYSCTHPQPSTTLYHRPHDLPPVPRLPTRPRPLLTADSSVTGTPVRLCPRDLTYPPSCPNKREPNALRERGEPATTQKTQHARTTEQSRVRGPPSVLHPLASSITTPRRKHATEVVRRPLAVHVTPIAQHALARRYEAAAPFCFFM